MQEEEQNNKKKFTPQEVLEDALVSEKFMTGAYNAISNECSNEEVRNTFMNILNDEHKIQFKIFDEMSKRGWYQTTPAEQAKVNEVKQKFHSGGNN